VRSLWITTLVAFSAAAQAPAELTPSQIREDFALFVSEVGSTYAYFDGKATRWNAVATLYEGDLQEVHTRAAFIELLERAIAELYDDHAHLNVNTATSPKLVPSGTDLWAEWAGPAAMITDVREGSGAEHAGILAGAVVMSINGCPVAEAAERLIGRAVPKSDPAARNWALRRALAGRHGETRRIEVEQNGEKRVFELPPQTSRANDREPVTFRRLEGNAGLIHFHDSLGGDRTVEAFDRALAALRDTNGLVLDLRDTPSGGNSTVARGILGRFVAGETGYQKHADPAEERDTGIRRSWIELVSPRGPFRYSGRVAVLVGRWTGSMGEGLAIGFDAAGSGTTVGGPMAQLLGATYGIELPHSRIGVSVPAERLFHVNGTPREAFQPKVRVPASAGPGAVLEAGRRIVVLATTPEPPPP
jgi:carboxyl-terminal processing protease